ncbi:uncharacterized protein BDV17DRAFT_37763 [Aspergillus undulatus]|uniref:uncharacterized protein n=1 Tax=Aspergillus undulatus TaxID=1810928 RepID=UPI003CCE296B
MRRGKPDSEVGTVVPPHYVHAHRAQCLSLGHYFWLLQAFMQLFLHNAARGPFSFSSIGRFGPPEPFACETWTNHQKCRLGSSFMTPPVSSPNLVNSARFPNIWILNELPYVALLWSSTGTLLRLADRRDFRCFGCFSIHSYLDIC